MTNPIDTSAQGDIDAIKADIEAAYRDAKRYRWMRDRKNEDLAEYFAGWFFDEELDTAIDKELGRKG